MTARPRPLTTHRRLILAEFFAALATELQADHAEAVQALLAAAADTCWPSSTTGGRGGTSEPATPVERAGFRLDSAATSARWLLDWLNGLEADLRRGHALLMECAPGRPIAVCPWGHPLTAAGGRCTHTDPATGVRCGGRPATVRHCADCRRPEGRQPEGDRITIRPWKLPNGTEIDLCNADWMFRYRHDGRPRASVARLLADAGDLVASDGTYSTPDLDHVP